MDHGVAAGLAGRFQNDLGAADVRGADICDPPRVERKQRRGVQDRATTLHGLGDGLRIGHVPNDDIEDAHMQRTERTLDTARVAYQQPDLMPRAE